MDGLNTGSTRQVSKFFSSGSSRHSPITCKGVDRNRQERALKKANTAADTHSGLSLTNNDVTADSQSSQGCGRVSPVKTPPSARTSSGYDECKGVSQDWQVTENQSASESFSPPEAGFQEMRRTYDLPDKRRKATSTLSPFFTTPQHSSPSCLRFPVREAAVFGLIQERLADDPFQLLIAVIFLHQTKGAVAVPILLSFIRVFQTPELLAKAVPDSIAPFIRQLGLQNRRAQLLISLARAWLKNPPTKGQRYRYLHYPHHGSGMDIGRDEEPLEEEDTRSAWEIAHLPGIGPYALDSWRIFCRDSLLGYPNVPGIADAACGEGITPEMSPEWTRVLPQDKELRAFLQWRWIRLGWLWDPTSGNRLKIGEDIIQSMERLEISHFQGFVNPWLSSDGFVVPEEQILGGFRNEF